MARSLWFSLAIWQGKAAFLPGLAGSSDESNVAEDMGIPWSIVCKCMQQLLLHKCNLRKLQASFNILCKLRIPCERRVLRLVDDDGTWGVVARQGVSSLTVFVTLHSSTSNPFPHIAHQHFLDPLSMCLFLD